MDVKVTWEKDLRFVGLADSAFPVPLSSPAGPEVGAGPVEVTVMALAACTAMDVLSILQKKQANVTAFDVQVHAERAQSYPKVITKAELEYVVSGIAIAEASLLRAIELSVTQYCPVHAMLSKAFPIDLKYSIFEARGNEAPRLVKQGRCPEFMFKSGQQSS